MAAVFLLHIALSLGSLSFLSACKLSPWRLLFQNLSDPSVTCCHINKPLPGFMHLIRTKGPMQYPEIGKRGYALELENIMPSFLETHVDYAAAMTKSDLADTFMDDIASPRKDLKKPEFCYCKFNLFRKRSTSPRAAKSKANLTSYDPDHGQVHASEFREFFSIGKGEHCLTSSSSGLGALWFGNKKRNRRYRRRSR